jgi:hypothetical protein
LKRPKKGSAATLLGVLLLALISPAASGRNFGQGGGRSNADARSGGGQVSAGQAAEIARRQTGGQVLSVERGSNGYRVKVLTPSGEIRYVTVPGRR